MSTLRITNIEAKADPSSPTVDEKIKLTNSNGDILVHIDGKTSGITTIGINTTAGNIKFDQNSNVVVTGIITATKFVGTIEPTTLTVGGDLTIPDKIVHTGDTNTAIRFPAADTFTVETGGTEAARVDSSQRLLMGASSTSFTTRALFQGSSSGTGGSIFIARNQATPSDGAALGTIFFGASNHSQASRIASARDGGTWTAGSSQPSRIEFATTADGANSPTERLRITSGGRMLLGTTTVPTGLVLGNSLTAASSTGAEVVAFRSDTSVAVGDVCGAFVIGNSDTDGAEDHFVGMWGKAASTNGSMNLHFAAGRASYEGDTPDVTIKSGGKIGIGTDIPDELLEVGNGTVSGALKVSGQSSSVTSDGLTVDWESSSNSTRIFSEPSSGGSSAIRLFTTDSGSRAEALRIDSSGNLGIGCDNPQYQIDLSGSDLDHLFTGAINAEQDGGDYALKLTALGKSGGRTGSVRFITGTSSPGSEVARFTTAGLTFGGDTAAANALDDYEEGSFIPNYGSGLTSPSYTGTGGHYTKIGNLVTFTIRIRATGTNSSGQLKIAGLPFASNAHNEGSISFGYLDNINGSTGITGHIPENSSEIHMYQLTGSNFNGNSGNGASGRTLHLRGFYYTNS